MKACLIKCDNVLFSQLTIPFINHCLNDHWKYAPVKVKVELEKTPQTFQY